MPAPSLDATKCGTLAGHTAHIKRHLSPCEPCREAKRAADNARNRERGMNPRPIPVCGTYSGYRKHRREKSTPCGPCHDAFTQWRRDRGVKPRKQARCGTRSGYNRHRRIGEQACSECLAAVRKNIKPRRYRQKLWADQNGVCPLCDERLPVDSDATEVDHIIPVSRGGTSAIENLQVVHPRCNRVKGTSSAQEARERLAA